MLGGVILDKVHWRTARVQDGDDFSLAELWHFPLAGLFAG